MNNRNIYWKEKRIPQTEELVAQIRELHGKHTDNRGKTIQNRDNFIGNTQVREKPKQGENEMIKKKQKLDRDISDGDNPRYKWQSDQSDRHNRYKYSRNSKTYPSEIYILAAAYNSGPQVSPSASGWSRYRRVILSERKRFRTGMRRGEILNLTWDKVDLKGRMIHLESDDTKEGLSKKVPISKTLKNILGKLPIGLRNDYVFLFRGKPIKDIRGVLKRGCEDAGIPYGRKVKDGFTFHDLRHTTKTLMRKAGVDRT